MKIFKKCHMLKYLPNRLCSNLPLLELPLYRLQMESVNKPKREVKQLTGPVQMYKPVSDHLHNVSYILCLMLSMLDEIFSR